MEMTHISLKWHVGVAPQFRADGFIVIGMNIILTKCPYGCFIKEETQIKQTAYIIPSMCFKLNEIKTLLIYYTKWTVGLL